MKNLRPIEKLLINAALVAACTRKCVAPFPFNISIKAYSPTDIKSQFVGRKRLFEIVCVGFCRKAAVRVAAG